MLSSNLALDNIAINRQPSKLGNIRVIYYKETTGAIDRS